MSEGVKQFPRLGAAKLGLVPGARQENPSTRGTELARAELRRVRQRSYNDFAGKGVYNSSAPVLGDGHDARPVGTKLGPSDDVVMARGREQRSRIGIPDRSRFVGAGRDQPVACGTEL